MNRAPGPYDFWWNEHKIKCGGTFVKIKEPEKQKNSKGKKNTTSKPIATNITKYITNNINTINSVPNNNQIKPILKDSSNVIVKPNTKTHVVTKKGAEFNPTAPKTSPRPIPVFTGSGHSLDTGRSRSNTIDVTETVRNIWANKEIPNAINKETVKNVDNSPYSKKPIKNLGTGTFKEPVHNIGVSNPKKHKAETTNLQSPPAKVKKIDDYFKATSILKDLYGEDYKLTQSDCSTKLVAITVKVELVDCPVCNAKFSNEEINRHLDECLNTEVIEKLSKDSIESVPDIKLSQSDLDKIKLKDVVGVLPPIPAFKGDPDVINNNTIDLTYLNSNTSNNINTNIVETKTESKTSLQSVDEVILLVKERDDANKNKEVESINPSKSTIKPTDKRRNTISFITEERGDYMPNKIKKETDTNNIPWDIKTISKPGPSTEDSFEQNCPCCGKKCDKPMEEHLDECLAFFDNNTTMPEEGASTSYANHTTIVIEDCDVDDIFDESQTLNATGTKTPCPCCMKMVEQADMNEHLDTCLQ